MIPLRPIAGFFLRLLILYGLLAWPWPWAVRSYSAAYRTVANGAFGSFGSEGVVRFQANPHVSRGMDTNLTVRKRQSQLMGTTAHNPRLTGYLPTALLVSLVLATPIPWVRRIKALFWGLLLVHLFVYLRLEITLLHWFSADGPWAIYSPGPFARSVLSGAHEIGVVSPMMTFVAPVIIWIIATVRQKDLDHWRNLCFADRAQENQDDRIN